MLGCALSTAAVPQPLDWDVNLDVEEVDVRASRFLQTTQGGGPPVNDGRQGYDGPGTASPGIVGSGSGSGSWSAQMDAASASWSGTEPEPAPEPAPEPSPSPVTPPDVKTVTATLVIPGAVTTDAFLAQVAASMPPGSAVELESFKMTTGTKTGGIPGDAASFGTPAAPTAKLTQYKDGLAGVFSGISSNDVTIKGITQEQAAGGRRRLQSSTVEIASEITSTNPSAASSMAAKISNATEFTTALATSVNDAGSSLESLDSSQLSSATPTFVTEVKVKVIVPADQNAGTATATLSDSTTMANAANAAVVDGTPAIVSVSAVAPPATKVDNTVTITLTLDTTIAAVAADSSFKTKFATDVGTILGVAADQITVESIASGSVIVVFSVAPAANGDTLAVSTVLSAFATSGVTLSSLNINTAAAVTAAQIAVTGASPPSPPAPPSPAPDDDDGLSAGVIILIVVGGVGLVVAAAVVVGTQCGSSGPKDGKPATGMASPVPQQQARRTGGPAVPSRDMTPPPNTAYRKQALEARLAKIKSGQAYQQASQQAP